MEVPTDADGQPQHKAEIAYTPSVEHELIDNCLKIETALILQARRQLGNAGLKNLLHRPSFAVQVERHDVFNVGEYFADIRSPQFGTQHDESGFSYYWQISTLNHLYRRNKMYLGGNYRFNSVTILPNGDTDYALGYAVDVCHTKQMVKPFSGAKESLNALTTPLSHCLYLTQLAMQEMRIR